MALTVKDLLEAGCHFGHQTKRWNPKMKEFVYGAKNGISIIDITKTIHQVADACNFLQGCVMKGGRILFVGTKRQAQQIVREASEATGMNYVMERWMGGTLTNNATIKKSIKKMLDIDAMIDFKDITKKLHTDIKKLGPFGPMNPKPLFCTTDVYDFGTSKVVGREQEHIKLELVDSKSNNVMNGIAFGQSGSARYIKSKRSFDIAYTIEDNVFKHNGIQLQIEDIRPSEE